MGKIYSREGGKEGKFQVYLPIVKSKEDRER